MFLLLLLLQPVAVAVERIILLDTYVVVSLRARGGGASISVLRLHR